MLGVSSEACHGANQYRGWTGRFVPSLCIVSGQSPWEFVPRQPCQPFSFLVLRMRCSSQAAAVGGNQEGGWNDIHENEDYLEEGALIVGVGVGLNSHVVSGTSADLSITAQT